MIIDSWEIFVSDFCPHLANFDAKISSGIPSAFARTIPSNASPGRGGGSPWSAHPRLHREASSSASADFKASPVLVVRQFLAGTWADCAKFAKRAFANATQRNARRARRSLDAGAARRQEVTGEAERASRISMPGANKTRTRGVRSPNRHSLLVARRNSLQDWSSHRLPADPIILWSRTWTFALDFAKIEN